MAVFYTDSVGDRPLMAGIPDGAADSLPFQEGVELWYNGVRFGDLTRMTGYRVTPRLDESRRHVVYNEFQMAVESRFPCEDRSTADVLADRVRATLSQNGAELYIRGRTVGEVWVNSYDAAQGGFDIRDVRNGPVCTGLEFEVLGGGVTGKFSFAITWCLPDCDDAVYTADLGVLEWNWGVDTTVEDGYTTRTLSGYLVIPQNRAEAGGRFSADSADRFKETIDRKHSLPVGFRRGWSFRLSMDRSRIDYTITDTELGLDAPPPGCLHADVNYETTSQQSTVLTSWVSTLTGRYEVPKYGNIQDAVNAFLQVLLEKMRACQDINLPGGVGKSPVIPLAFSARQPDLHGRRRTELSASWSLRGTISEVMAKSGIWKRVGNGSATDWIGSFKYKGGPFKPGGNVGTSLDVILSLEEFQNLCQPALVERSLRATGGPAEDDADEDFDEDPMGVLESLLTPTPEDSWIGYTAHPEFDDDDGVTAVRTLPSTPLTGATDLQGSVDASDGNSIAKGYQETSNDDAIGGTGGGRTIPAAVIVSDDPSPYPPSTSQPEPIPAEASTSTDGDTWVERRVRPQRFVYLVGGGSRYGFPVREPKLTAVRINGESFPVVRACRPDRGEGFSQHAVQLPSFFAVATQPAYVATWRIRYGIVGNVPPGPLAVLPNPVTGG